MAVPAAMALLGGRTLVGDGPGVVPWEHFCAERCNQALDASNA
jgi:hypothetical protein